MILSAPVQVSGLRADEARLLYAAGLTRVELIASAEQEQVATALAAGVHKDRALQKR